MLARALLTVRIITVRVMLFVSKVLQAIVVDAPGLLAIEQRWIFLWLIRCRSFNVPMGRRFLSLVRARGKWASVSARAKAKLRRSLREGVDLGIT